MKNIAILGCGNMGSAVAHAMSNNKALKFYTYTPSITKAKKLADELGGEILSDFLLLKKMDVIVIGCKPQQFSDLAKKIKSNLSPDTIILSLMAAISVEQISSELKNNMVVRLMPNTPCVYGQGVSLLYFSNGVDSTKKEKIVNLLEKLGGNYSLENETQLDLLTPLTGSGPAYFFAIAQVLASEIEKIIHDKSVAKSMVDQVFQGSLLLAQKKELDYFELLSEVTSKGGVTQKALDTLNLSKVFPIAIQNAYQRAEELSKTVE